MTGPLLIQLAAAFCGTVCFAILFHVPPRHLWCCGICGMAGWLVYWLSMQYQPDTVVASFLAVIPMAVSARACAILRKAPVTLFLIPGIFPLVPGAGIYYTVYYFIMGMNDACLAKGVETLKIAVAIALGIVLVLALPGRLFHRFVGRERPPRA